MSQNRVLFADNEPDFLDTRAEYLENSGYLVLKAYTLEQVKKSLAESRVHLAILDIRLVDDDDERDVTGLTLAKDSSFSPVPKIILTGFPTYQAVREVLGPVVDGLPPAVDFLDKREGPEAMVEAVERVLSRHVSINWELVIRWSEQFSFVHLVSLLEPKIEQTHIFDRAGELEDLFRRLFFNSSQITISRLLTRKKNKIILIVVAFSPSGIESQFVVACGERSFIREERDHFKTLAPKATGEVGVVEIKFIETVHFAAIVYALNGGNLEDVTTLAEFYRDSSVEMITTVLNHLFGTTLTSWYEQSRLYEGNNVPLSQFLLEGLRLSKEAINPQDLEPQINNICQEGLVANLAKIYYTAHSLTFHLSNGSVVSYPNPIAQLHEKLALTNLPVLTGITYGKLNGDNLLVDRQGRPWLIDFNGISRSPLLLDFVSLETALKFELLSIPNVFARYELEKRLLAAAYLDEMADIQGLEPEVSKTLQAIGRVRYWASTWMGRELNSYLVGLLFCTVAQLVSYNPIVRYTRRELIAYLHQVLSIAMICQKLMPRPRENLPPQAINSLWIDEPNKEVWVEGRSIRLTPQEFDFLLYLYNRQGQLCSREDIAEHVFGAEYKSHDMSAREKNRMEETRLNSTMSRMRRKIEPDPDMAKYIIAIRGEGYRLELPDYAI